MGNWKVINSEIVEWARNYNGDKFHALLCDPPYNLDSIKKRFGKENSAPAKYGTDGVFARSSAGFMGKEWDSDVAFMPDTWVEIGRHLYAGAFCMAFSSTRTYHRLALAVEAAGFVIHPMIGWINGSGFPKSTRLKLCECKNEQTTIIQKTWDNNSLSGVSDREVHSDGLVEKESDSLLLSQLSKQVQLSKESGSIQLQIPQRNNASGSRKEGRVELCVEGGSDLLSQTRELQVSQVHKVSTGIPADGSQGRLRDGTPTTDGSDVGPLSGEGGSSAPQEPRPTGQSSRKPRTVSKQQRTQDSRVEVCAKCGRPVADYWKGHRYGLQALKPSFEPICVFQKPYEGRPLDNIISTGAGTMNINGARFGEEAIVVNKLEAWSGFGQIERPDYESVYGKGRYPANVVISGDVDLWYDRFFYCAKANRKERDAGLEEKNPHPTVKPIDLCKWLATLLLPPVEYKNRSILVPFSGSGSEIVGSLLAGWDIATGVEIEEESCKIAQQRIEYWSKE